MGSLWFGARKPPSLKSRERNIPSALIGSLGQWNSKDSSTVKLCLLGPSQYANFWISLISDRRHVTLGYIDNTKFSTPNQRDAFTRFLNMMPAPSRFKRGFYNVTKRKPVKIAVVYVISLVLGILLLKKLSEQGKTKKKIEDYTLTEVTF